MKSIRRTLLQVFALALVGGLLAGCAHAGTSEMEIPEGMDTFTLQVDNDNFNDARVYVFWNGRSQSLGRIRGSTTETFELPYHSNRVRLRIEFVQGGERIDTQPYEVLPNQVLRHRITP